MDTDGESPPFWFQPPTTPTRSYRRSSSPIINPVVLIILLPILALLLIFFLLPPFLSHASFIFRPNSVKKSWDSINIFLVFFAILCGVLARRNDDNSSTDVNHAVNDSVTDDDKLNSSVPNRWFEDSHRKLYTSSIGVPQTGVRRLRRNSSYPDLKQESSWETGDNVYRFYDDFEVNLNLHRSANLEYANHRVRQSEVSQVDKDESDVKVIPVDTFQNRYSPPRKSPSPPPAPPPPPPPPKNLNRRRTYRSIPKQDKVETRSGNDETEFVQVQTPPPPTPPPPPPPPPAATPRSQHKREKSNRKKSSATKDIATTIASLYNQTKRKRRHKTRNIYDNATQYPPSTDSAIPPAPPPPPPPPSVFHNMFRKGIKSKRIHSLSTSVPPPPPPPPPPGSIFNNLFKNSSKSKRFSATTINSVSSAPPPPPPPPPSSMLNTLFKTGTKSKRFQSTTTPPPSPPPPPPAPLASNRKPKRRSHIQPPPEAPPPPEPEYPRRGTASSGKPPLPTRSNNYYERDEYLNSGAQSPLIPMPPPPPPFKMAEMKFMFRGDFVSISSNQSSRSTSPEREEIGASSANRSPSTSYGGGSSGSGFCPSPDVNVKAATFIARLRDEWRAEKMNAVKEKQKMGPNAAHD